MTWPNVEIWQNKSSKRKILWFKPIHFSDVNVDNIVISKLVKTKTNSKCLIGYLDKVVRSLVLILPQMSGYVKSFKAKDVNKDKNSN